MKAHDRAWVWVELPRDAALTPPPGLLAEGAFKGAQRWAFATAAGGRNLVIRYVAYLPLNASPADAQKQIAEAANEFSGIINLVTITEP